MRERRRGAELERALLDAAWAEMDNNGYSGLTMDGVAERAGTSRPVIARRWDGRGPLAVAAIRQQMARYPLDVPDRGCVRIELLEYLERASQRAKGIAAAFSLFSSEYLSETDSSPKDLRSALISGELEAEALIMRRAVSRGEIDISKLKPPLSTLLSDLFRHHAIMNFTAPSERLREDWVDKLFIPLVRLDSNSPILDE